MDEMVVQAPDPNAQFQRSTPDTPPENKPPPTAVDAPAALARFARGTDPADMSGKEYHAMLEHLKQHQLHADEAHGLEISLMKIKGPQFLRKREFAHWIVDKLGATEAGGSPTPPPPAAAAAAPLTDVSNAADIAAARPQTAPPSGAAGTTPAKRHRDSCGLPRVTPARAAPNGLTDSEATRLLNEFAQGRDHLTMTGKDLYALVSYLKTHGHDDIEDALMRFRVPADKKHHLVNYIKRVHSVVPIAEEPAVEAHASQVAATAAETTAAPASNALFVGEADPLAGGALKHTPPMAGKLQTQIATLEATLLRMEESHAFAVECMVADMSQARAQLTSLRSTMQSIVDVMQS